VKVPLLDLNAQYVDIMADIHSEIDRVFASHQYILGPVVAEFERDIQKYLDIPYAVGCASGTDAIELALRALDIGAGDEVITTPFTFFASASTIHRVGAKPVFIDIDERTFNLNPDLIEPAITKRTKAILPVHLFGQPAEMDKIMSIAKSHNLYVIEDNAQGIGCKYDGKFAGTIGHIGTLSFFPSKNLGAMGDGGMCLTHDEKLATKIRQLRTHGENPKYYHKWVGLNSRLDSLQAAVLKVKLPHLQDWSDGRRKNAKLYAQLLSGVKGITLPYIHEKAETIYNQYTILCDYKDEMLHHLQKIDMGHVSCYSDFIIPEYRDDLMQYLQKNDIGCAIYYPLPLHLQECFAYLGYKAGDLPVSEKVCKHVLSLPIYGELTESQIKYVAEKIAGFGY